MNWNIEISAAELVALQASPEPPRLLDVRQPDEHALVALPGARLIPLPELAARLAELEEWRPARVVVYCHHGMRSLRATELLRQAGFAAAQSLAGGIDGWSVRVDPRLRRY